MALGGLGRSLLGVWLGLGLQGLEVGSVLSILGFLSSLGLLVLAGNLPVGLSNNGLVLEHLQLASVSCLLGCNLSLQLSLLVVLVLLLPLVRNLQQAGFQIGQLLFSLEHLDVALLKLDLSLDLALGFSQLSVFTPVLSEHPSTSRPAVRNTANCRGNTAAAGIPLFNFHVVVEVVVAECQESDRSIARSEGWSIGNGVIGDRWFNVVSGISFSQLQNL